MGASEEKEAIRIIEDVFSQGLATRPEQARSIRLDLKEAMGANGPQWACASHTDGHYGISFNEDFVHKRFWFELNKDDVWCMLLACNRNDRNDLFPKIDANADLKISLNEAEKAFEISDVFDQTWTEYANLNRGMSESEVEEAIRIIEDVFSQGIGDRFEQARRILLWAQMEHNGVVHLLHMEPMVFLFMTMIKVFGLSWATMMFCVIV